MDHLYSMDDNLKAGGPLLLLEEARENPVVGDEHPPETTPIVEPASISRCCIERGLFSWVDHELLDPSTCDILSRAQVLNAIFLSKLWDIHIEAKMLRHVVRRWSTATHTFDYLHERVFPLALAIAQGDRIPLAPMFLGHLYQLLNQTQLFEKSAVGTMGVETLLNSSFLHVFLWECLKGLDVYPLPYSRAIQLANLGNGSFMPDGLLLICRWFKRMQRKGQNFLKLLENIENFIFRPYDALAEAFTFVPFYADVGDTVEVPTAMSQSCRFKNRHIGLGDRLGLIREYQPVLAIMTPLWYTGPFGAIVMY
ncbi:unnamed protein product [Prunus armeniaca]